jgi:ADP-ribosyl-[dinitrogen reductase] hydrolase
MVRLPLCPEGAHREKRVAVASSPVSPSIGEGATLFKRRRTSYRSPMGSDQLSRAQGCLLGQLAGDSLGSLVEFLGPEEIRRRHPNGVRDLTDGGTWNTIAGQPTDDSEMALALARSLVAEGRFDAAAVREAYLRWYHSRPFDIGGTISAGLGGRLNHESQANGSLMRISPLGIFAARFGRREAEEWARADAALTHPHPVCGDATALFAMAIATAVSGQVEPEGLYRLIRSRAVEAQVDPALIAVIDAAAEAPPAEFVHQAGWVLIAFQNALYQLLHALTLEAGVVDTVMRGGDTDTNAAIAGALLGAVHGAEAIPGRWREAVLACRPEEGAPGVRRPRPEEYWPVDALELAAALVGKG